MDYKNVSILAVLVAVCPIASISCCKEVEFITCERKNMTCAKPICHCTFTSVHCSSLTEVPKDLPKAFYALFITRNSITRIKRGDFNNMPNLDRLYLNDNKIRIIEPGGFANLTSSGILMKLDNNNLYRITAYMFSDIPISSLSLSGNRITLIETHAFVNLPRLNVIFLSGNLVTVIEKEAFVNLPQLLDVFLTDNRLKIIEPGNFISLTHSYELILHLQNNNLSRITTHMFRDITLSELRLNGNPITVIEKHAFVNLPLLRVVSGVHPFLKEIEAESFVNISTTALQLVTPLSGNIDTVIQRNAFINVHFSQLYFASTYIQCDCDLMWLAYLRYDQQVKVNNYTKCAHNNKNVFELIPDDFNCIDNVSTVHSCNASQFVDLPCVFNYLTTNLIRWIHSRNGKFIRELNKDFVVENTNTLHFPFCNHDDSGEYTCTLSTDYSLLPNINRSVHLLVNGPPIVLNQHTEVVGDDLILSVMFYSIPYDFKIQWLLGNNSLNGDPQYTIDVNNMTVGLKQYNVDVTTDGFISNLTIHNFRRRPSDVYNCQISNQYGLIVEQIILGPASLELERRAYCDTSHSIELKCTLKLVGATPVPWIHSNAGETIRSLPGRHVNTSNILTIPFCNSQDTGDYTCRWKTDVIGQKFMEKSTKLFVSGPPFVISHSTSVDDSDTVFSITFFSIPFPNDPKWYYNNEPVVLGTKFLQTTTYSIVQIRQHRVLVNVEGFITNLTVHNAEYGLYKCVILNSFGKVNQIFVIEQEQSKFSISTTEATTSAACTGNSVIVIIAICSTVFGIALVVICIIIFIRRISSKKTDRYNSTMPTRNEDSTYDTISMSSRSNRPEQQEDYIEVF